MNWKSQFFYHCHWQKWSESECATALAIALKGSAHSIISQAKSFRIKDILEALDKRYNMPQLEIAHRGIFDNMVRKRQESFANFGNRLLDQSKLAFPKMSEDDRDDLCALRFSRVMQNEDPILHKFLINISSNPASCVFNIS